MMNKTEAKIIDSLCEHIVTERIKEYLNNEGLSLNEKTQSRIEYLERKIIEELTSKQNL